MQFALNHSPQAASPLDAGALTSIARNAGLAT